MKIVHEIGRAAFLRLGRHDFERVRPHQDTQLAALPRHQMHARRVRGIIAQLHALDPRHRIRRHGRLDLVVERFRGSGEHEMVVAAIEKSVDLRLEQIHHARERQNDDEGQAKQAGIEMPTPNDAIGRAGVGGGIPAFDWTRDHAHRNYSLGFHDAPPALLRANGLLMHFTANRAPFYRWKVVVAAPPSLYPGLETPSAVAVFSGVPKSYFTPR